MKVQSQERHENTTQKKEGIKSMKKREICNTINNLIDRYRTYYSRDFTRAENAGKLNETEKKWFFYGNAAVYSEVADDLESFLGKILPDITEKWKMKDSYKFYENGYEEILTKKDMEKMFEMDVDEEQKKAGTTFETWVYEMEKMGILV